MPYQDFTKRLRGSEQPLSLPEYELATQVDPVEVPEVDPQRAAVEKIFGKSSQDTPNLQPGKQQKYRSLGEFISKEVKPKKTVKKRLGTQPGSVAAQPPSAGAFAQGQPQSAGYADALNFRGTTEAEKMADRAIGSEPNSFLQKLQNKQKQTVGSLRGQADAAFSPNRQTLGQIRETSKIRPINAVTPEEEELASEQFVTQILDEKKIADDQRIAQAKAQREEEASRAPGGVREVVNRFGKGVIGGLTFPADLAATDDDPFIVDAANTILNKAGDIQSKYLPVDERNPASLNVLSSGFYSPSNLGKILTENVPEAAGSAVPFALMGGGVGGAARRLAPAAAEAIVPGLKMTGAELASRAAAGGMGAAGSAGQSYREAKAAGASDAEAGLVGGLNSMLGWTEALGASGTVGVRKSGGLRNVRNEFGEEFFQEGVQSGGKDVIAKGTYDPNKSWSSIVGDTVGSAAVGGIVGGMMAMPGAIAENRPTREKKAAIADLVTTQPEHPVVQVIAQAGIDPVSVSQADDRAVEELSIRLQAMARMDSQIQQLQQDQGVLQQQALNAADAQRMGRVPSTIEQQQVQQLPVVEQQLAEVQQAQAEIVQDLQQNVSPLFRNLAKAIGQSDIQPIGDVQDDVTGDLVKEVRKAGGINAEEGAVESGELQRLSPKEIGSTGLISRKSGEKADVLREQMVSEGLSSAETPSQFIEEVETAARRGKTEEESYREYQRSQMSEEELADSDKLDELLTDRAHPFTVAYRALENPKTILTSKLRKEYVKAGLEAGFSDDFIDRSLAEFQQQRGFGQRDVGVLADEPDRSMAKPVGTVTPGKSVSMSPYKVLEANNRDLLKKLYDTNLNSEEGKAGIAALREYADAKDIEQKHVDAHITDIYNWQKKYGVPKAQQSAKQPKLLVELQPKIEGTAPVSSGEFSLEQRQLLGRDHTNLLDSEFDEYLKQLQNLQKEVIQEAGVKGIDTNSSRYKGLRSKIFEVKEEREKRRKAGRLPSLASLENRPAKAKTPSKAELGRLMVEQDRARKAVEAEKRSENERETESVPRETANVPQIDEAAHEAATSPKNDLPEPTEAQKEAGNYKKGHISIHGLDVTIENPEGSVRSGKDASGKEWEVQMSAHYGYIRRTVGADEEQIDVYVGPGGESTDKVFVVDQVDAKTGKFDEHKVIFGAESQAEAEKLYDAHFDDKKGPDRRGAITGMSVDGLKKWLKN